MLSVGFYLVIFAVEAVLSNELYKMYCVGEGIIRKKREFLMILIAALPCIIISSIRVNVGTDYENYISMFHYIRVRPFFDTNVSGVEFGIKVLVKIIVLFTENPRVLFVVTSFLYGYLMKRATFILGRMDKIPGIMTISFLLNVFLFAFSLNGIRQAIAIAFVFNSLIYIKQEKKISFIVCIILATIFHTTAIMFIALYFLRNTFSSAWKLLTTFLLYIVGFFVISQAGTILSAVGGNGVLSRYALQYTGGGENINIIGIIVVSIPLLLGLFFYKEEVRIGINVLYMNITVLGLFILFCSPLYSYFFRLIYYCYPAEIMMVPMISSKFKQQYLVKTLYIVYGILYFIDAVLITGLNNIIPYQCTLGGF